MANFLESQVLSKALELLTKYPLCNACLGRAFSTLSRGHLNSERGIALKLALLMELDERVRDHQIKDLETLRGLLINMGTQAKELYKFYFTEEFRPKPCFICSDQLDRVKEDFKEKAIQIIRREGLKNFVLGVKLDPELKVKEIDFATKELGLHYESVKNELKREVGKFLSAEGFTPNLENPEVELIYDMKTRELEILKKREKVLITYNRFCRGTPVSSWSFEEQSSLEEAVKSKVSVPFAEFSDVRVFEDYPAVISGPGQVLRDQCFSVRPVGSVDARHRKLILSTTVIWKKYRVTVVSEKPISGAVNLLGSVYDVVVGVPSMEELYKKMEELGVTILSIDLLEAEGKYKKILESVPTHVKGI